MDHKREHRTPPTRQQQGRRQVGRPTKIWLESVGADMAELEIDRLDTMTVINEEEKSNPI